MFQILRRFSFPSVVSVVAIIVSTLSAIFTYQQNAIGERNTFWSNITSDQIEQKNLEKNLLYTLQRNGNRVLILINDLTDKKGVACSNLQRDSELAKPVLNSISSSSQQILASYLTSILGNEQLGSALDISGWSSLVHGWVNVLTYWNGMSLTANQAQIDSYAYEKKCAIGNAKHQSVPPDTSISYNNFKNLKDNLTAALNLPNNKLYQALILANLPSAKP